MTTAIEIINQSHESGETSSELPNLESGRFLVFSDAISDQIQEHLKFESILRVSWSSFLSKITEAEVSEELFLFFLQPGLRLLSTVSDEWKCIDSEYLTSSGSVSLWHCDFVDRSISGDTGSRVSAAEFGRYRSLYDSYVFDCCFVRLSRLRSERIRSAMSWAQLLEFVEEGAVRGELESARIPAALYEREIVVDQRKRTARLFRAIPAILGEVTELENQFKERLPAQVMRMTSDISVVIPTRGDSRRIFGVETNLIVNAVRSLLLSPLNEEVEVVVVHDTNEQFEDNKKRLEELSPFIQVVPYSKSFNFAEKCNLGALSSKGENLVFMNDDVEVFDPWFLSHLCGVLSFPNVGAVGPLLFLDDGRVQSAGHINTPLPENYGAGLTLDELPRLESADFPREVSGLTAAAIAVSRKTFEEIGGFSLAFPNNFNDVDFCQKILEAGRSLVWTPLTSAFHFESLSRDVSVSPSELGLLRDRWGRHFVQDQWRHWPKKMLFS